MYVLLLFISKVPPGMFYALLLMYGRAFIGHVYCVCIYKKKKKKPSITVCIQVSKYVVK